MRFLFVVLIFLTACENPASVAQDSNLVYVAGVIRMDPDTKEWFVINDVDHTPLNVSGVITHEFMAEITFEFKAKKVISFVVTPDESYALRGIFVGASVGLDKAFIAYSENVSGVVTKLRSEQMVEPFSNLWFYGILEL